MKFMLFSTLLLASFAATAATVKITSFNYIRTSNDYRSNLAELCGRVEGATASPTLVKVMVDPSTNRPGTYNTMAGADGKFCIALITFTGNANASVDGDKATTKAQIK